MYRRTSGMTLLELLIVIALLSLVVLGFIGFHSFSHYHVISSDRRTKIQNEASFCLEHMTKEISKAIGDFNNPAIVAYSDNKGIRIKIDTNGNGRRDDDVTDNWIAYRHENIGTTDSEVRYYDNAGTGAVPASSYESIARHLVITNPSDPNPENWGLAFYINFDGSGHLLESYIEVRIKSRWLPAQPVSADNPEVIMRSRIKMPSVSTH